MAESTLSLSFKDYQSQVGVFLGWGAGADFQDVAWSATQTREINFCVASGIRKFYYPAPPYDWTFLKPLATIDLPIGAQTIQMPDDFGGFEGPITLLTTTTAVQWWQIELTREDLVRRAYSAQPTRTGRPVSAGLLQLKGTTQLAGQRQELIIFPIADATYQLQFKYYILGDMLTGTNPYVYGGAQHVETILESCLAVAEQRKDDAMGVHSALYSERLAASVGIDRRNKPQMYGKNRDTSDSRYRRGDRYIWGFPAGTYNGVSMDD